MDSPTPNLVQMHEEHIKRFINEDLQGGQNSLPNWFENGLREQERRLDLSFMMGWSKGQAPLEKEMATHSSILAWKISRTEDPGGLQSMGLQRVEHN